jgi:hypothetical protein
MIYYDYFLLLILARPPSTRTYLGPSPFHFALPLRFHFVPFVTYTFVTSGSIASEKSGDLFLILSMTGNMISAFEVEQVPASGVAITISTTT